MNQLNKPKVFIPITDATSNKWEPFISRSYDNDTSIYNGSSKLNIVDTIRSSCAAPTYFASVKLEYTMSNIITS
jgi:patatin-like phospholipase/acyl hydrolase